MRKFKGARLARAVGSVRSVAGAHAGKSTGRAQQGSAQLGSVAKEERKSADSVERGAPGICDPFQLSESGCSWSKKTAAKPGSRPTKHGVVPQKHTRFQRRREGLPRTPGTWSRQRAGGGCGFCHLPLSGERGWFFAGHLLCSLVLVTFSTCRPSF